MGLLADGPVGHGAGLEAGQDGLDGLHLVDGHGSGLGAELQQAAQGNGLLALVVDDLGVALPELVVAAAAGGLQQVDGLGAVEVDLAVPPVLVAAAGAEARGVGGPVGVGLVVAQADFPGDDIDADAADAGGGAREILVHEVLTEAQGLKNLGAVVALHRGDAHLGHDLHDALVDGLDELHLSLGRFALEHALAQLVVDGLEGQVGVHGAGAVANEGAEVVHLTGLAGLQYETDLLAGASPQQVVLDRRNAQQGRDGRIRGVVAPVREDQDVVALGDGLAAGAAQVLDGLAQALAAGLSLEQHRQGDGVEAARARTAIQAANLFQLAVEQHGRGQLKVQGGLGHGLQQVAFRPDGRVHGQHDALAVGVHWGVGDLRKELLEVVVEQLGVLREDRQGDVRAHAADGLGAVRSHGAHDHVHVFKGVAEGLLPTQHGLVVGLVHHGGLWQVVDADQVFLHPVGIGLRRGQLILDLIVGDDAAQLGVHQEHASGLEAPLLDDLLHGDVQDTGLARHHDQAVLGVDPPGGAQAIAVQDGADANAVGEGDGGGTVPGLHEAGVVLVEGLPQRAHGLVPAPGLGHHHHQRMGQGPARHVEQLQDVVEHRRVRALEVDDRQDLLQVGAQDAGREEPLAALHPVHVAAQGVDLTVVGDVAVGVGPGPAGEGVGGEAGVHHGQAGHKGLFGQIRIEGAELLGVQHALVDHGPAGEAGDVEVTAARQHRAGHPLLGQAADHVELALEVHARRRGGAPTDEDLADDGLAGPGGEPQRGVVRGDVAPAQDHLALAGGRLFEDLLASVAVAVVRGQVEHANAVLAGGRQLDAHGAAAGRQEGVGDLGEDAGPVTRGLLAARGTAVHQVAEDLQGLLDDVMGRTALGIRHEPEAAGIMLLGGIV